MEARTPEERKARLIRAIKDAHSGNYTTNSSVEELFQELDWNYEKPQQNEGLQGGRGAAEATEAFNRVESSSSNSKTLIVLKV
jgi:hypothetical protein